jgi:hypothetical protein
MTIGMPPASDRIAQATHAPRKILIPTEQVRTARKLPWRNIVIVAAGLVAALAYFVVTHRDAIFT